MKMKSFLPFLVILVLLLGLVVWQKSNQKKPAPIAEQIGLAALVPDTLTKSTLDRVELFSGSAPEDKVVLQKKGEEWLITSLHNAPADKNAVDDFIGKILAMKGEPRATADNDEKLANFALKDDEAFHVQAWLASGESPALELLFGKAADFRTVFVRKAGESKVFVENNNLRREAGASETGEDLRPKSNKWLKTQLFDVDAENVAKLTLKYPDKELVFDRKELEKEPETQEAGSEESAVPAQPDKQYEWALATDPGAKDFKSTEVKTILTKFSTITAMDVAGPDEKDTCGFNPPAFTATVSFADGSEKVFYGGRNVAEDKYYLQQAGQEPELMYQVAKYNFEQVFVAGSKIVSLPEWNLEQESLAKITMERPEGKVVLEKDGSDWKIIEPQLNLEQQTTALKGIATALASLKAIDYADQAADTGALDTTIRIAMLDGSERVLRAGSPSLSVDGRYVKFDDSDSILVISRADSERILPPVRDLFSLAVLDIPSENLVELNVTQEKRNLALKKDPQTEQWAGTFNGKPIAPGADKVEDYLMTVNAFQMDSFTLSRAGSEVEAAATLSFVLADGEHKVLSFGAEKDGNYEASLSWLPCLFTAKSLEYLRLFADIDAFAAAEETSGAAAASSATETAGAGSVVEENASGMIPKEESVVAIDLPSASSGQEAPEAIGDTSEAPSE